MTSTSAAQSHGPLVPPADLRRDLLLAVGGLVALVVCGLIAHSGTVSTPERYVFRAFNDLPGWLYPVMWPVQQMGNLVFGLVVTAVALVLRQWRLAIAALIVTFVDLEPVIKSLVVRLRPGSTVPDAVLRGDVPVTSQSFPSGHAVLIASLAVICTPYLRGRWRLVPWVLVALVCIGRVYVGAHNPLDVIAGCGLGLIIGAFANIVVHLPLGRWWRSLRPVDPDTPATPPHAPRAVQARVGRIPLIAVLVAGSLLLTAGCGGAGPQPSPSALADDAITVGSFDFAESRLLAEIYSQALERDRLPVQRALSLGPREFAAPALSRGLVEVLPEYAGTALAVPHPRGRRSVGGQQRHPGGADARALEGSSLRALAPAPAQDANAFVVTPEVAERFGLRTLSDVARVAPQLTLGGPPECPSRPTCLVGLREVVRPGVQALRPARRRRTRQPSGARWPAMSTWRCSSPPIPPSFSRDWSSWPTIDTCSRRRTSRRWCVPRWSARWGTRLVAVLDDASRQLTTDVAPAAERGRGWWDAARQGGRRLAGTSTPDDDRGATAVGEPAGIRAPAARPDPQAVPPTVEQGHRRRRPSGAPPPLPRHLGRSGQGMARSRSALAPRVDDRRVHVGMGRVEVTDRVDAFVLRQFARLRTDWLTDVATAIDRAWSGWPVFFAAAALLVAARRVPALAPPVHVRRQRRGLRDRRPTSSTRPFAAPARTT